MVVFLQALEVVLDVYTFLNALHHAFDTTWKFLTAGVVIGKGVINAVFFCVELVVSFQIFICQF